MGGLISTLLRRRTSFDLRPASGTLAADEAGREWRAAEGLPCFELDASGDRYPGGWVLLESALLRDGDSRVARLYWDTGSGFNEGQSAFVPVSRFSGHIREVLRLPVGARALRWVPMHSPGRVKQHPIAMRRITALEAFVRRVVRVLLVKKAVGDPGGRATPANILRVARSLPIEHAAAGEARNFHLTTPLKRHPRGVPMALRLRPQRNVIRHQPAQWWKAEPSPAFELRPDTDRYPEGWTLLHGHLSRHMLDGSARLLAETPWGEESFDIPVSITGKVFELVRLPRGTRRLVWQPTRRAGTFLHSDFTAREVPPWERLWLMVSRVAFMLWSQPRELKKKAGLAWWRPWLDLAGQYRACGTLRAYVDVVSYADWVERFDRLTDEDRARIRRRIAGMPTPPTFAVVLVDGPGAERTRRSLERQLYRHFALVPAQHALDSAHYVCVVQAGDQLAEHALYWMAEALQASGAAMAYADEDTVDPHGARLEPRFKPDWSPEHLRSVNYLGRWVMIRARELRAAGGLRPGDLAGDGHALNLRIAEALGEAPVLHVPAILYHRSAGNAPARPAPRARYPLPARLPLVSIIVPTRDALGLLRTCIDSIVRRTTYPRYELLIVDNRSREPETLEYLERLEHRVLRYDGEFNYSAINNFAARQARGEVLVLLNNDTEVISRDWLEEMLGHLHRPQVGAVGAKLYYSNGNVQHAGDAVGPGGCADHLHSGLPGDAPGYCQRARVAHEVSAVTAACMMTYTSLYERLGGLDERRLPVSFNDVDFCLRVQEAGYRVVFTPHAELFHHESASRGKDTTSEKLRRAQREVRYMRRRWGRRMQHDPYYNPNLSYQRPDFSLSESPRVRRPWLR